jgi:type IV secretion system protein VirB1
VELFLLLNQCAPEVHPRTMAAIIQAESDRNIFAIGINSALTDDFPKPTTLEEAQAVFKAAQGANFDVGLAQINSRNFDFYGLTAENAFEPCKNIATGGDILKRNFLHASKSVENEQDALMAALSAYNTGNYKRGLENGYVDRVKARAKNIVVPDILADASKAQQAPAQEEAAKPSVQSWRVFEGESSSKDVFSRQPASKSSPLVFAQ